MLHNIVEKAEWPQEKRVKRSPRKSRRMNKYKGLYAHLKKMAAGDTVAVEMLDGQDADKAVSSIRNGLLQYRSDLGSKYWTRTKVEDTVQTLYIKKRYGVLN